MFNTEPVAHIVDTWSENTGGEDQYVEFLCSSAIGDLRLATDADERCQVCLAVSRKFAEAAGLVVTE